MSDGSPAGGERFHGWSGTGCGNTEVTLALLPEGRATLALSSRWMGDEAPLELVLDCRHEELGSHSGVLELVGARAPSGAEVPLPPSDGPITLEYVRVPPQRVRYAGSEAMAAAGSWNEGFSLVLWVHRDACWDDGTDLDPDEYDPPAEAFRAVAEALSWLERPWKLSLREELGGGGEVEN